MFDLNVKTPSHDKIVLSDGSRVLAFEDGSGLEIIGTQRRFEAALLDDNDAIRLAAFLNRWYTEKHKAELRKMAEETKARREAKERRYAERRAARDA